MRRQAKLLTFSVYAQAGYRAIGVGEIARYLVDFEDFTIIEPCAPQGSNILLHNIPGRPSKLARVAKRSTLSTWPLGASTR